MHRRNLLLNVQNISVINCDMNLFARSYIHMFDNLKKLHELKKMQDSFKKEKLTVEKRGIVVTMNGNFEVEEVRLNSELNIQDQQQALKEVLNEARENMQKTLAKNLASLGFSF